jgi:hypothetical protein
MKEEKELWLDEDEVMKLLEGKTTWDQVREQTEKVLMPSGRNDGSKVRLDSDREGRENYRGGSPGGNYHLVPTNTPQHSASLVPQGFQWAGYQSPQTPQILPGPANDAEWLRPQNPNLRTIDSGEQNVFFFQKSQSPSTSHSLTQEPAADYSAAWPSASFASNSYAGGLVGL